MSPPRLACPQTSNLGRPWPSAKGQHGRYDPLTQFSALIRGRLTATLATTLADRATALALRRLCFRTARGLPGDGEGDRFDTLSDHILIRAGDACLATFRTRLLTPDTRAHSYSAQFYDLSPLPPVPVLELGRFCLHPDLPDPDALRLALAALTRMVDQTGAQHLVGCTSFDGTAMEPYADALAPHRGQMRPMATRATETLPLKTLSPQGPQRPLPPLLRHYLTLGGTLSDHAVVDRALHTCHVFTVLSVADIPAARARLLRDLARDPG